jgi:hypothetical protein
MLDLEGSGSEANESIELEAELDQRLRLVWGDRAKAIVIKPELDIWVWGSDNVLSQILSWSNATNIRDWLRSREHLFDQNQKPLRPKEALEELMREMERPRSSALYEKITTRISLERCVDPAFLRLKSVLQEWFHL